jgi:hypothetical protein
MLDFGAMDVDSVAGDVARLVGSMAGDDVSLRQVGLEAYACVRPLSPEELALVATYDRSGVLLSGVNWIRWLVVERRPFPDRAAVDARLIELTGRLRSLAGGPAISARL